MMGTFMKGAFIAGLAAFNWALAAPVTTPSSLDNLGAESASALVSSPGLSQIQSSSQAAEAYPDYGSYNAPFIVSNNDQNIAMLQSIKSEAVLYYYLGKNHDPVLLNTWEITHDLMVEGILNQSVANQKTEIALLQALCKATKGCVLPQP